MQPVNEALNAFLTASHGAKGEKGMREDAVLTVARNTGHPKYIISSTYSVTQRIPAHYEMRVKSDCVNQFLNFV